MKLLIKNIALFFAMFVSILVFLLYTTARYVNSKADFTLSPDKTNIILGNSHPEYAFNDSLIPTFKNLAHSAEAYLYTYTKIKKIHESNPQIKCVFIEFGNINLGEKMNQWTWGDRYMIYRYPLYSPFMSFEDHRLMFTKNPKGFINSNSLTLKNRFIQILNSDYNYFTSIGGYKSWDQTLPDSFRHTTPEFKIKRIKEYLGFSDVNLNYLDKIIQYCREQNLDVYLIRSPIHSKFNGYFNELLYQQLLKSRYKSLMFFDFSKFPIFDDEIGDYRHLNHKGSKKFSIWFNSLLQKGLLDKAYSQSFIDNEIQIYYQTEYIE